MRIRIGLALTQSKDEYGQACFQFVGFYVCCFELFPSNIDEGVPSSLSEFMLF